jgi:hypothetical protein
MGLITMLIRGLRMLLSTCGVFLALGMVTLAMMFGGGTVGLGGVFVMFGCFVVFVSGHCKAPWLLAPSQPFKALRSELFLHFCNAIAEFVKLSGVYWWRRPATLMGVILLAGYHPSAIISKG